MNKFAIYLLSLVFISSCSSNSSESNKSLINSSIFKNDGKYLVVPLLYGCDGCVQKTYEFIKKNHVNIQNNHDFYVVWTQLKNKRQVKRDYDEEFIKYFIVDSMNILASEIDIYPILLEIKSGQLKNKITFSPDNLEKNLKDLEGYLNR